MITTWFREYGINARISCECDGVTSLISAVEAGLGVAMVVERIACLIPERIVLKDLYPQPKPVCIAAGILARQSHDPMLTVFIDELNHAGEADAQRPESRVKSTNDDRSPEDRR